MAYPQTPMTLEEWKAEVLKGHPTAKFVEETGDGETYGEPGDVFAATGPDMQADVVGAYSPGNVAWMIDAVTGQEVYFE